MYWSKFRLRYIEYKKYGISIWKAKLCIATGLTTGGTKKNIVENTVLW